MPNDGSTHDWLARVMPDARLARGPARLALRQWLAIPLGLALAWLFARVLAFATRTDRGAETPRPRASIGRALRSAHEHPMPRTSTVALVALASALALSGCSHFRKKGSPAAAAGAVAVPDGYVTVRVGGVAHLPAGGEAVLLVEDAKHLAVPIFIGGTEAMSIELRLKKREFQRPLTHDLYDATLAKLGGHVESVRVDKIQNNTFYGTVVVTGEGSQRFELDARPSDAIALAIGNGAPIHVARTVIDRAGLNLDDVKDDGKDDGKDDEQEEGRAPPVSL